MQTQPTHPDAIDTSHILLIADLDCDLADFSLVLQRFERLDCSIEVEFFRDYGPDAVLFCETRELRRRIAAERNAALH